jgi:Zn-dependent peptidase ImmA (M78 family)
MTMTLSRRDLAQRALQRSIEVRRQAKVGINGAVDPFELCARLGVKVQFVDVSMEGFYRPGRKPRILLSALRPLVRRVYNCGHELGHWAFGHGSTLDALLEGCARDFQPEEFLVDTFAGFLLMPPHGVRRAFVRRGWKPATATPEQLYTIACAFGVGYETFLEHCARSLEMLPMQRLEMLLKQPVRKVRESVLARSTPEPLVIVDAFWELPTVDVEIGTLVLLPEGCAVDGAQLELVPHATGRLYRATMTGIGRIEDPHRPWAAFVRVTRFQYVGFSTNRHLEDDDHDDD